jgi:hypothetical protein
MIIPDFGHPSGQANAGVGGIVGNPYESPNAASNGDEAPTCTFCGKTPEDGSLVQAPGRDVYICASCARIASGTIEVHETRKSLTIALLSLSLALILLIAVPVNWFLWNDAASIGGFLSISGVIMGLVCLSQFAATIWYRARRG